jgi:hypothetical protein
MPGGLDRIMPALAGIGAVPIGRREEQMGGQTVYAIYLEWRGRLIRAAWSIVDSLSVELSTEPATDPDAASWRSLFAHTVPGFERFDDAQKLDWIIAVPKDEAFPPFVAEHIRRLPAAVPGA